MTKNEFYKMSNSLREENLKLLRLERRLEQINSQQGVKAGIGSEINSNNNSNYQETLSAEKIDLEKEKKELEIVIAYNQKELERYINKIDDIISRDLLYYKYVKHLKWYDIADILNYTIDHTRGRKFREAKKKLFTFLES